MMCTIILHTVNIAREVFYYNEDNPRILLRNLYMPFFSKAASFLLSEISLQKFKRILYSIHMASLITV